MRLHNRGIDDQQDDLGAVARPLLQAAFELQAVR